MRYLSALFFVLLPFLPCAQDDPLNDPDIAWATEVYTNHWMGGEVDEVTQQLPAVSQWNLLDIQRFQQQATASDFGPYPASVYTLWQAVMLRIMLDAEKPAYKTAELVHALSEEEQNHLIYRLDTVITFNPTTLEEQWSVVRSEFDPAALIGIRTRGILYRLKGNTALHLKLLAFAPLQLAFDERGTTLGYHPVLWYPLAATTKKQVNLEQDHYIVTTRSKQEVLHLDARPPLRGKPDLPGLVQARLANRQNLYSATDFAPLAEWEYEEIRAGATDTITTFHPATYEASVSIVERPPAHQTADALRLVIRWYWLAGEQELKYETIGYAPVQTVKDETGNLRYYRPLVYIKD